ncbi:MAG TPA: sigma-70 family RNA polymerase sigma factor [Verrucomicrobiae bacterium]|nr:sigma-70 family RNA polymerase sigma factor [Verrucomicrobiae bacterium]
MEENVQSPEPCPTPVGENPREPPDITALTRRMTEGDEMAWRTFYSAYFDRLLRYLLVVAAGNEDTAREALQGTLVRVTRHVKVFHDENVLWSWLTVLARSALADESKKRRRYFSFLDRFMQHARAENDGANERQTEERLQGLLERQVGLLPPDERGLIEQKYFARRAVREIADELQTTEKAVESKLSRVRKKLKDAVLAELNHEPRN